MNRDPRRFETPDEFIVSRADMRHVGFGTGIHHCFGAPLARLKLEVGVSALAEHFPGIELVGQPRRQPTFVLRGYDEVLLCSGGPRPMVSRKSLLPGSVERSLADPPIDHRPRISQKAL